MEHMRTEHGPLRIEREEHAGGEGRCGGVQPCDAERELFDLMRRFRHERYDMRPLLTGGTDMTTAEAHVLAYLLRAEREGRCVRPSDVARRGRITPSAISQTLKALEGKGMVARERSAHDSRSVTLRLTERGRASAVELFERRSAMVDELVSYVGEDELRAFAATLGRVMEFCDERLGRAVGGEPHPGGRGDDAADDCKPALNVREGDGPCA